MKKKGGLVDNWKENGKISQNEGGKYRKVHKNT